MVWVVSAEWYKPEKISHDLFVVFALQTKPNTREAADRNKTMMWEADNLDRNQLSNDGYTTPFNYFHFFTNLKLIFKNYVISAVWVPNRSAVDPHTRNQEAVAPGPTSKESGSSGARTKKKIPQDETQQDQEGRCWWDGQQDQDQDDGARIRQQGWCWGDLSGKWLA